MKRTLVFFFLVIMSTVFSANAQIKISANIKKVLEQLNIKQSDCYDNWVAEVVIPYSRDKSIVVIPKIIEKDEYSISCDSYILIIDNHSGKILNSYFEPNSLTSDAVKIERISIDLAPYKLNKTTRAFGIIVLYEGSSRPNPYRNEELSLFITRDSLLVKVLKNFSVSSLGGEWDTQCDGQFVTEKKVITMSDKTTNNFFDIVVKSNITTTNKTFKNGNCADSDSTEIKASILHYNGHEYK